MYKIHWLSTKQANEQKKKKEIKERKRERERAKEGGKLGMTKYLETEKTNSTAYKASTL